MSNITIFADNSSAVSFADKKGNTFAISPEGALFKGGAALASLKDMVLEAAGSKAANGKYRAAADILATAFPAHTKGFEKYVGLAWSNKASFVSYLNSIETATAPKNGYSKRQAVALDFIRALRASIPSLAAEVAVGSEIVATV
jgi:hypothetical protein